MPIKPSPRSDHRAHNQVMITPSKSTVQRVGITPPATPTTPKSTGKASIPGSVPNSPGIKPKGSKNGMC